MFIEFLIYAQSAFSRKIIVCTYGAHITDIVSLEAYYGDVPKVEFQITNDKRYYPKKLDKTTARRVTAKYKNAHFVWRIGGSIYPQGRARSYMKVTEDNSESKGTRCFNLRSIMRSLPFPDLSMAVMMLEGMGGFCQPSINIDGSFAMGESPNALGITVMYTKI